MTIHAQTPFGTFEFPDGTSKDVIDRAIKQRAQQQAPLPGETVPSQTAPARQLPAPVEAVPTREEVAAMPFGQRARTALQQFGRGMAETFGPQRPSLGETVGRPLSDIGTGIADFAGNFFDWMLSTDPAKSAAGVRGMAEKLGDVGMLIGGGDPTGRAPGTVPMVGAGETIPQAPGPRFGARGPSVPGFMTSPEGQAQVARFQESGMTPTVPISGGPAAQRLGRQLQRVPFVGGRIEEGAQTAREQAHARLEELAGQQAGRLAPPLSDAELATPMTQEQAGSMTRNAMQRYAADKTQASSDYNRFFSLMHGAPLIRMDRTLNLLNQMLPKYEHSPELEGLFQNPNLDLGRFRRGITPRTETIPGRPTGLLDPSGAPLTTPATTVQRGQLSVQEVKQLNSEIGRLIESAGYMPESMPKAQLRRLYGAVKDDLRDAARQRSPAALNALERANAQYNQRMNIMERLEPILRGDSDVPVYRRLNLAAQERSADSTLLRTARNVMNPQEWSDLGAAMIRKMAYPARDAPPDRMTPDFNLGTFHTNWRALTPQAKDMLFGPNTPGSVRYGLETMSELGRTKLLDPRSQKEGTRAVLGGLGIVGEVLRQVGEGRLPSRYEIGGAAGLAGTGYMLSNMMMSPRFARVLYTIRERGERLADPVGTGVEQLRAAMAADAADRRQQAEDSDLRQQAYAANRRGNIADVQRFDRQRARNSLPP